MAILLQCKVDIGKSFIIREHFLSMSQMGWVLKRYVAICLVISVVIVNCEVIRLVFCISKDDRRDGRLAPVAAVLIR